MGRYLRPTLILNHPKPMTRWHRPAANNVLGFPCGIHRNQLLEWGHAHVAKYQCVTIHSAVISRLAKKDEEFHLTDFDAKVYRAKGLIIAVGIEHDLPDIPGIMAYAGHSVWHCPECDGYKCLDKPIVVIGNDCGSAEMALGVSIWSSRVTLCLNGQTPELNQESRAKLEAAHIAINSTKIAAIRGDPEKGALTGLELEDGALLPAYGAFVNPKSPPAGELLSQLPLELLEERWIKVDHRMRTNIPRCYAVGDIVAHAQTQLSVAMGTGATAAIWLHKELLPPGLCLSGREW
jgi:thioredoxin reductase